MRRIRFGLFVLLLLILALPSSALAQSYAFELDRLKVDVYWESDGSQRIEYKFVFKNTSSSQPIDFVDIGLPNSNFDQSSISAQVNGKPVAYISASEYQGTGTGVAVALGSNSILPGKTGTIDVVVGKVERVLRPDTEGDEYASAVFSPTWFGSQFISGTTDITVTFHLPPGVQPEEPRWHAAPANWSAQPITGTDSDGRVTYTWTNPVGLGYEQYKFGASFPIQYVPAGSISSPSLWEQLGIDPDALIPFVFCCGFASFFIGLSWLSTRSAQKRKLQYLPPKIAIEGMGIKRGLTAIEAAILLEQPLDKVLTMILFSSIKKNAARVVKQEPLTIETIEPLPNELQSYELDFLVAFQEQTPAKRRKALQELTISLVKSVSNKMKGFSRRETIAYYKDIVNRAWAQVEAAQTPEVKSAKYDEVMEWTMLDQDYDDRTREIFRSGPVFAPRWWGRYDPSFGRPAGPVVPTGGSIGAPGGQISLPTLPGASFAASVVNGVQNFSAGVVGNLAGFTSGVTNKTNPIPVTTSSSSRGSSGGRSCACACACAGCACACAGGGR
jgi:hypothetical protein